MKNIQAILTVILLLLTASLIFSQQYDHEENFNFVLIDSDKAVLITSYKGNDTVVRIPPRIKDLPVTWIGQMAFAERGLVSLTIPDTVVMIGSRAFVSNQLTSVTIPNSVLYIGNWAFASNQLNNVTIPDSVREISVGAFSFNQLNSVNIPRGVFIGNRAFFKNNTLTSITIGDNVTLCITSLSFDGIFDAIYKNYHRSAGTYTRSNTFSSVWIKQ